MIENYKQYLEYISSKLSKFFIQQKNYIKCYKGCGKCCKNAEFPFSKIEFKYILTGFVNLEENVQQIIENNIQKIVDDKKNFKGEKFLYDCPFLINDMCSVYDYRGIVCRAFGLIENSTDGKIKVPFCHSYGLNYSDVVDSDSKTISQKKYIKTGYEQKPLGYNVDYKFLTDEHFEKQFNFNFGEKKPLIDWFLDK